MKYVKTFENFDNENENVIDIKTKINTLKRDFKDEYTKYFKAMNNRIMSVEIDALYNVLVLNKESEYELTRKHEANVREILER